MTLDLSIQKRFHSKNYQLIKMIGQGGFGIVYKARQISTDQIVAIKFLTLSSEFDTHKRERYLERFQRETALSSRLQHPNIVRLLDKGVCDDDLVYAVFEYVDGKSLKQHLSEKGALLPVDTANLMGQVLDALSHAHDQGVIHRDLKPANIMLSSVGTKDHIKILDFGIGTLSNEVRQHDYKSITLTHETLGTPSYSAPEQLRGESPSIKSDIYVWGLVFIECLTGEPAITGNSLASIFHKQLSLSNVPIPTAVAGHPVANLLRRVLNKKMNERAGDASLIYHDLKQININSLVGDLSLKQKSATPTYLDNSDNYSKAFISSLNNLDKKVIDQSPNNAADMSSLGLQETQINTGLAINTGMIERKQISILCVTLTLKSITESMGSSDEECDLELLDVLHRDSKSQCIDIAVRYGAFHAGTLGDTLLFYFGYPAVSDNDSRLCARTALDITSNINQRNALLISGHNLEIEARMGMHAGMVSHYPDAMPEGGAINTAMELARLSRAKQVLCSQASKRLLEGYIEFKMALSHTLGTQKGTETVHQLIGERLNEAFGFLRGTRSAHAFVGREEELEKLTNVFNDLSDARPSYIHIYGEAGIGKSRLIYEVRGIASSFQQYMCQCLPEHKYSGLHPVLSLIKSKFNLIEFYSGDENDQFISNMETIFEDYPLIDHMKAIPLLLTWLNLPIPKNMSLSILNAEAQKEILFNSLSILLLCNYHAESKSEKCQKSFFVFEDVHWSDPTSYEFFEYFLKHKDFMSSRSIFLTTSRKPETGKVSDLRLCLSGLEESKCRGFIEKTFGREHISEDVYEVILSKTDGIPLYMEELVSMMVNKKIVHHFNGVIDFVNKDSVQNIPETLIESLQNKIDSLVYSKETAQLASSIGREFDYGLLAACSHKKHEQINKDLLELLSKELIYKKRRVDRDIYIFKHALVKDAVYYGADKEKKKFFHNKVAKVMSSEISDVNYELISRHFERAENYNESVFYGIKYLKLLIITKLNSITVSWYNELIDIIKRITNLEWCIKYEVDVNKLIIPVYISLYGYASDEVKDIAINTANLLDQNNEDYEYFIRIIELNEYLKLHHSNKRDLARDIGENLLVKYRKIKDYKSELILLCHISQCYFIDGEIIKSIKSFEYAISLFLSIGEPDLSNEYGIDVLPHCYGMISLSYLHYGEFEKSMFFSKKAVLESNTNISKTVAYIFRVLCLLITDNNKEVIKECFKYYSFNNEVESDYYKMYIDIMYNISIGNPIESFIISKEILKNDNGFALGWYLPLIAKALIKKGDFKKSKQVLTICEKHIIRSREESAYPIYFNVMALYFKATSERDACLYNLKLSILKSNEQSAHFFKNESVSLKKLYD